MTIHFSRITIFYILFMALSALCFGILNSYGKFATAAAAPVLLNIILPIILIAIWAFGIEGEAIGYWLSWGVFAAGLAQFLLVFRAVRKLGIRLRFSRPRWTPEMKRLLIVALPATLTAGVGQINLVIGRQIASWTEGAMSWLAYADRLYQLPMGLIGVAIGVVLLPTLTSLAAKGDDKASAAHFNEAIVLSMFFTLPAAVALFIIPVQIVQVMFEGGRFSHSDTIATANAIMIYATGLPAAILQRSQMQLFFAREDTKTPFRFALISMIVNVSFAIGFWKTMGYLAPVLASVISSWVMCILLYFGAKRFGEASKLTRRTVIQLLKLAIVAILMGVVVWWLAQAATPLWRGSVTQWLALFGIVIWGGLFYFAAAFYALGFTTQTIKRALRR